MDLEEQALRAPLVVNAADEAAKAPREWRHKWYHVLGDGSPQDVNACCLSWHAPAVAFGWNSSRGLGLSWWREALKFFLLTATILLLVHMGSDAVAHMTCSHPAQQHHWHHHRHQHLMPAATQTLPAKGPSGIVQQSTQQQPISQAPSAAVVHNTDVLVQQPQQQQQQQQLMNGVGTHANPAVVQVVTQYDSTTTTTTTTVTTTTTSITTAQSLEYANEDAAGASPSSFSQRKLKQAAGAAANELDELEAYDSWIPSDDEVLSQAADVNTDEYDDINDGDDNMPGTVQFVDEEDFEEEELDLEEIDYNAYYNNDNMYGAGDVPRPAGSGAMRQQEGDNIIALLDASTTLAETEDVVTVMTSDDVVEDELETTTTTTTTYSSSSHAAQAQQQLGQQQQQQQELDPVFLLLPAKASQFGDAVLKQVQQLEQHIRSQLSAALPGAAGAAATRGQSQADTDTLATVIANGAAKDSAWDEEEEDYDVVEGVDEAGIEEFYKDLDMEQLKEMDTVLSDDDNDYISYTDTDGTDYLTLDAPGSLKAYQQEYELQASAPKPCHSTQVSAAEQEAVGEEECVVRTTPTLVVLIALTISTTLYTIYFAARRRALLRERFGIDGSLHGDCCLWAACAPCALAQETRTMMYNNVEEGLWAGPSTPQHIAAQQQEQCASLYQPPTLRYDAI